MIKDKLHTWSRYWRRGLARTGWMVALLVSAIVQGATAGERVALVIGNSAYQRVNALPNAHNDAQALSNELKKLGFEVITAFDLTYTGFTQHLRGFEQALVDAKVGLVFYAGHAIQVDGANYLVPVEAMPMSAEDITAQLMPMANLFEVMQNTVETRVLLLDACRDNPFVLTDMADAELTRGLLAQGEMAPPNGPGGLGLAETRAPVNSYIGYATAPGNVALDGSGDNSPFTAALLRHLGQETLTLSQVMTHVRVDVLAATGGFQVPWESSSLTGELYLAHGFEPTQQSAANRVPIMAAEASRLDELVPLINLLKGEAESASALAAAISDVVDETSTPADIIALLAAVKAGQTAPAVVLADMFVRGLNVPSSTDAALPLLAFATGQGQGEAAIALVELLETRSASTPSPSAERGITTHQNQPPGRASKERPLTRQVEANTALGTRNRLSLNEALYRLSGYLLVGTDRLPADAALSRRFLLRAAGNGYPVAQLELAERLVAGEGFLANPDQAMALVNRIIRHAEFTHAEPQIVAKAQQLKNQIKPPFQPD